MAFFGSYAHLQDLTDTQSDQILSSFWVLKRGGFNLHPCELVVCVCKHEGGNKFKDDKHMS